MTPKRSSFPKAGLYRSAKRTVKKRSLWAKLLKGFVLALVYLLLVLAAIGSIWHAISIFTAKQHAK